MSAAVLPVFVALIAVISLLISPRANNDGTFFKGLAPNGRRPGLLVLTFSQVTTWIFARSLMNAAILGFYYGIWGTLAYAVYYFSFLTGAGIIDSIRFTHGYGSVQDFLRSRFGVLGTMCYNLVIGIRLISEVFANLLVIGILFGAAGGDAYVTAILAFSAVTLLYSALGGLHASLRTDLFQMAVFLIVLLMLLVATITSEHFTFASLFNTSFDITEPGPILLIVAILQIWSYPMHDPVMMDRGFIADRQTTLKSFYHAAWISVLCITAFGALGVFAGDMKLAGEDMNTALTRLLGAIPMLIFSATLIISAMSTLDSTLSSSAKLVAVDMNVVLPTLRNGRITMVLFMLAGLFCVFYGTKDLFAAVAVSGTASMYLAPVVFFSLWLNWDKVPVWSYVLSFLLAVSGACLYFFESSGYIDLIEPVFGFGHKYSKLLLISIVVLVGGALAFVVGQKQGTRTHAALEPA
jgi:Na+/proline symporter